MSEVAQADNAGGVDERILRLDPGLYVVGTPIGNLRDVTLRALDVLRSCTLILSEDTRHTRKLLSRYGIRTPMTSCHRFNEASRIDLLVRKIDGEQASVALVSDAGMPGIADPGARAVSACRERGIKVEVIPGPSSLSASVALSGYGGAGFLFEGFLPHKSGARARRLEELASWPAPVVLFESPHRIEKLMGELVTAMPDREVFVVKELTKFFEKSFSGHPADVAGQLRTASTKGEFVVVLGPAPAPPKARASRNRGR
jgi:16S rRNA (cytidine1402-2'-O)-methyltransferase